MREAAAPHMAASPTEVSAVRTRTATPDWYSWGIFRPFPRSHICRKKKKKEFQPSQPWGPSELLRLWPPSPFPTPPTRPCDRSTLALHTSASGPNRKNGLHDDTPDQCLPRSHKLAKRLTARLLTHCQSPNRGYNTHNFFDTATRSLLPHTEDRPSAVEESSGSRTRLLSFVLTVTPLRNTFLISTQYVHVKKRKPQVQNGVIVLKSMNQAYI